MSDEAKNARVAFDRPVSYGETGGGESGCAFNNDHLAWACERWQREVAHRPLRNVHRRTLDDTWRQVIRRLGGDPDILLPMADHDSLVADNPEQAARPATTTDERAVEALRTTTAHLVAAVSLLKRGGKKAAPSDKMFHMMIADYEKAIAQGRAALAQGESR